MARSRSCPSLAMSRYVYACIDTCMHVDMCSLHTHTHTHTHTIMHIFRERNNGGHGLGHGLGQWFSLVWLNLV